MEFIVTYPDYNTKAFTISYDDCTVQDQKVMKLAKKYGVAVTFALNTAYWGQYGYMNHVGYEVWIQRPNEDEVKDIYEGFEIASHTASHPALAQVDDATIKREVKDDMDYMYRLTGQKIIGICYPSSSYNDHVIELLRSYGLIYGRTADSCLKYELPENFMIWVPTCHDEYSGMTKLVDQMIKSPRTDLLCYYVWGHAYELDKPTMTEGMTRWQHLEALFKQVGTSDVVWCATNGQIATCVLAVRKCVQTDTSFENRSDQVIYAKYGDQKITIQPGETFRFE